MRMSIAPFDAVGRARIEQLIAKSNQFNLTTKRYNSQEIREIEIGREFLAWQVRLSDRFAEHGMISVVIVRKESREWQIDTWLMSCRVLERGVENALMNRIFALAHEAGVAFVRGVYRRTDRNMLVENFFSRMGFLPDAQPAADPANTLYELAVADYSPFDVKIDIES
jgi:FkbH-like protein